MRVIPEVLAVHVEEFLELWRHRQDELLSTEWTLEDLRRWDERVVAHFDALLVASSKLVPIVEEHLSADERGTVSGAALLLLCVEDTAAHDLVFDTFLDSESEQLLGLRDALCFARIDRYMDQLRYAVSSGTPDIAIAAAYVLASQERLDGSTDGWREFLTDEEAEFRRAAWEVVAIADQGA